MMKEVRMTIGWVIGTLVFLLTGCDQGEKEVALPGERMEIAISGAGGGFVQTRGPIGENETGPKFGMIHIQETYICETEDQDPNTGVHWGHYEVRSGTSGMLSAIEDKEENKLFWESDSKVKYDFYGISVPPATNYEGDREPVENPQPGVKFNIRDDGVVEGEVTFGDYTRGLEYFVGGRVYDKVRPGDLAVAMTFQRQVCKIVFEKITHYNQTGEVQTPVLECEIIFPNLPSRATFNIEELHPSDKVYGAPGTYLSTCHYVTLHYDDEENGIKMKWRDLENKEDLPKKRLYHALYVPPFKFWGAESERPENQPGFFVVIYNDRSFTGNIYGIDINGKNFTEVYQGEFCNLKEIILKDGPATGGGDGSVIIPWSVESEEDVPHHRYPGVYSADDAKQLLEALLKKTEIPEKFYEEREENGKKVKVIRLFTNMDWSEVTGELIIPTDYILAGQGYNVTLGSGGSLSGIQKGNLYINEVLYVDGVIEDIYE